jgi:AAA15 family ATPase/GTPase
MLIQGVRIQGFRCFDDVQIDRFSRINLIGGQNNAGKTALLEALLLLCYPHPQSIGLIRTFREEGDEILKSAPSKAWNYLFHKQSKENSIKISSGESNKLEITYANGKISKLAERYFGLEDSSRVRNLILDRIANNSALHFSGLLGYGAKREFDFLIIIDKDGDIGAMGNTGQEEFNPPFLHTRFLRKSKHTAALYSEIKELDKEDQFISLIQVLDPTIEGVEIDSPGGEPILKLKTAGKLSIPANLFGDGIRKMIEIILVLLSSNNAVIFIDEIENGLHFSKQKEIWMHLFKIARSQDIQIFATSHSFEMIKAFNDVSLEPENHDMGMYFEMGRGRKTGNIIINPMPSDMLQYEISHGLTFRGE